MPLEKKYEHTESCIRGKIRRIFYTFYIFYLIAVGESPGDSSSTRRDFSILRLSIEVPFGIKAVVKSCTDKCKSEREPLELALSFGLSEVVGQLSIGFGATRYELAALSRKLYGWGWERRYVCLSNRPDKNYSIFYCSAAVRFPHIERVMFSDQEFINRWKAGLWNKIYLNSILKGSCLCVKTFQPITTVVNKDNISFQLSNVPHIGCLWRYFVEKKIVDQLKINKYTAT